MAPTSPKHTPARPHPARPGSASSVALILSAVAAATALLFASHTSSSSSTTAPSAAASRAAKAPMTSRRLLLSDDSLLQHAGLSAPALAAVGASAEDVGTAVAAGRAYLAEHGTSITQALSDFKTAQQQVGSLENLAQSGRATEGQVAALATARTTLATAKSALDQGNAALFNAAIANLSSTKRTQLANIRDARALGVELPLAFLVTTRSEASQVAIRDALAELRTLPEGSSLSEASQAVLDAAREDSATTQAETDVATLTQDALTAWNTALQ